MGPARPLKVMKNTFCLATAPHGSVALSFVIPSAAEGSAVLQARPGNVFDRVRMQVEVRVCRVCLQNVNNGVDMPESGQLPLSSER